MQKRAAIASWVSPPTLLKKRCHDDFKIQRENKTNRKSAQISDDVIRFPFQQKLPSIRESFEPKQLNRWKLLADFVEEAWKLNTNSLPLTLKYSVKELRIDFILKISPKACNPDREMS